MLITTGRALAIAAGCSVTMGLGIVSCSDDTPPEDVDAHASALVSPPPNRTS